MLEGVVLSFVRSSPVIAIRAWEYMPKRSCSLVFDIYHLVAVKTCMLSTFWYSHSVVHHRW